MSTAKPKAAKVNKAPKAAPAKATEAKKSVAKAAPAKAGKAAASPVSSLAPAVSAPALVASSAAVFARPKRAASSQPAATTPSATKAKTPVGRPAVLPSAQLASKPKAPARAQTGEGAPVAQVPTAPVDAKLENKLASNPPKALNSPIRIFQIYFEGWQRELLDPAFYPLDNSRGNSELMEFNVFEQLQRNAATQNAELWGALSWKFAEKTGMQGADLVKQIVDHPGYDVYFMNPHPYNEALYHNMWVQGEVSHPEFLELSRLFHAAAGLDEKDLKVVESSANFSAANYFVASPKFWALFIAFVKRVLVTADKRLDPKVRDLIHSKVADDKGLHAGATYVPFIVERLFMTFMRSEGKDLKGYKIALPERERELNVHLKLLREMKDVAHKTQSAWLAACWVNYRNLYMSQTNGKAWCEKYLRAITPTEVRFG
jgi:hypothetical protein